MILVSVKIETLHFMDPIISKRTINEALLRNPNLDTSGHINVNLWQFQVK